MRAQVEVIYENGVLRPLEPLSSQLNEDQRYLVTIEGLNGANGWPQSVAAPASLEDVRAALRKIKGTLAEAARAEREER